MAALALVVGGALVACSQDESLGIDPEPDFYTVQLGWDGEIIDVMYEPLDTRATTDDLYGIQVYSTPDEELDEGETVTWTAYAYGLFDDPSNISINLLKGYKYKFVATMVRDGKNKISQLGSDIFSRPFAASENGLGAFDSAKLTNSFDYQSSMRFWGLETGLTNLKNGGCVNRPNTDRFYGELVDYVPGDKNATAKINMKRTAFGAKFIAKGAKAKEGTLHVLMTNAPAMELALTTNENKISDIFTFSNVAAAWADNKYTETIDVTINWERADGTTLPLGTHAITYKRNATTVVQVKIENDGADGGLGFEIDESETGEPIEDGENDVTIEDGEVVDTEVDTNGENGSNEESESASIPNNQIWYNTTDGNSITPPRGPASVTLESNTYNAEIGMWVLEYSGQFETIEVEAFSNCPTLSSIAFPEGVKLIREDAFPSSVSLNVMTIPTTVASIDYGAIRYVSNIKISDLTAWCKAYIGKNNFLSSYNIYLNGALLTELNFPIGVNEVSMNAFKNCKSLTKVILHNDITLIGSYAFSQNQNMSELHIGDNIQTIGAYAFSQTNLKTLTIPANTKEIYNSAFRNCSSLETIYCLSLTPPEAIDVSDSDDFEWKAFDNIASNAIIYVPASAVDAYKAADGWKDYADKIFADE